MKTFLEEYGFVILIAIVIILLIVMATPVGSTIKASILGLTNSFDNKTDFVKMSVKKKVLSVSKGTNNIVHIVNRNFTVLLEHIGKQG